MPKYQKRPVTVEARQWDGTAESAVDIVSWIKSFEGQNAEYRCHDPKGCVNGTATDHDIAIRTLEGTMSASVNDFIIQGVQGEFYPCKPDIFAATYEEVNDDAESSAIT